MRHLNTLAAYLAVDEPAGDGGIPVFDTGNWQQFLGVAIMVILTVGGLIMAVQFRSNTVRKQLEHFGSALVAVIVIAAGLIGGGLIAWGEEILNFFTQS